MNWEMERKMEMRRRGNKRRNRLLQERYETDRVFSVKVSDFLPPFILF